MATSGFAFSIHSFDFSKPENTRFQYGSSVCLLSIAAPIAGTCDDATPAMILATFRPRLAGCFRFRFARLRLAQLGRARFRLGAPDQHAGGLAAGPAAVALGGTAAGQHHRGVVVLGGAGHDGGEMSERMAVGRAELGGEIDVAA